MWSVLLGIVDGIRCASLSISRIEYNAHITGSFCMPADMDSTRNGAISSGVYYGAISRGKPEISPEIRMSSTFLRGVVRLPTRYVYVGRDEVRISST